MTNDYALGFWQASERAIAIARAIEGDCGGVEQTIINSADYQQAESIVFGQPKPEDQRGD